MSDSIEDFEERIESLDSRDKKAAQTALKQLRKAQISGHFEEKCKIVRGMIKAAEALNRSEMLQAILFDIAAEISKQT
jgi:hypothetical protein